MCYHVGMTKIIVGGVVEQSGKYLLVQEAKEKCRGKWNLPAGHLDSNETILEGAIREIKEESGFSVALTGVCQIGTRKMKNDTFISVFFTTKILDGNIHFDPAEILDVRWFTYQEILAMRTELRQEDLVIGSISNAHSGIIAPLELVKIYRGNQ